MIRAFLFDAKGEDREIAFDSGKLPRLGKNQLLWLDLATRRPEELERLRQRLKLQPEIIAALKRPSALPALTSYDGYFHCSIASVHFASEEGAHLPKLSKGTTLDFVVGREWLVTIAEEELPFLAEFRDRDRGETIIGTLSSASLAAALLDWHLAGYHATLEALEEFLELMDVRLLAGRNIGNGNLRQLVTARRYVAHLRRNLAPQRLVFYGLARPDFMPVIQAGAQEPYRAIERHFDRLLDAVEHAREMVQASFDLFETRIAESTNVLVRRLTLVSIMLGGMGAVAGIFGMNFQTTFTASGETGFWIVIAALFVAAMAGLIVSRIKRWI